MSEQPGETGSGEATLDPKWEAAVFGREVQTYIDTDPVAAYLIERARTAIAEAQDALIDVDPNDSRAVATLQLDARVANRFRQWIREAIENGRSAEILINQERDEHGN